ncbi:SanA/YdcF family protein [Marinospirillum alkaliphilum]|uniref:SanA protein n=1 Tax=Marinospirillum alkaliphilum DSM 21637 TaxID=1122209 RepID=A0A1K1W968_9GAMM|nr:ElyC/SanA/YdcF family protein [Marinospirillum alkaliphilum]SFX33914.1 SanA protein [Marinospirillum alkaliphilum DSM 21637]
MRKLINRLVMGWWYLVLLVALSLVLLLAANSWFVGKTADRAMKPEKGCDNLHEVVLVFGTSQFLRSGRPNPHYYGRIDLAAALYHQGKVRHLLLSGDNRTRYYNEPGRMQQDLLARGVPEEAMTLDHAGFSTFDSLKRSRDIFELHQITLITQGWHLPRALFIADHLGLDTLGCAAGGPEWNAMKRLWLREVAARLRTLGDLYIWKREPRLLGDPEPITL